MFGICGIVATRRSSHRPKLGYRIRELREYVCLIRIGTASDRVRELRIIHIDIRGIALHHRTSKSVSTALKPLCSHCGMIGKQRHIGMMLGHANEQLRLSVFGKPF